MSSKITLESFLQVVQRSGLLEGPELKEFLEKQKSEGQSIQTADQAAQCLIEANKLTAWQAKKLLQGRHKGFFLGKYRLHELLGKGGMSSVYLAEHNVMRRRVALKVLPFKYVDNSSYLERFYREAQAIAALDHPNIVRAYDVDSFQDDENSTAVHYLVMEYVEGRDLHEIVAAEGPLDVYSAVEFVSQAARGLEHAHDAGFIHRDIKPGNLLVDSRGTVKLLDLGLARLFGGEEEASVTKDNDQKVLGTADFLSPEQAIDSHDVDPRTDQYSLGCTLYFLLTGQPPFPDGTLAQRLLAHQTKSPPKLSELRSDVPDDLVRVVEKMMAKKPEDRYADAKELAEATEDWLKMNRALKPATAQTRAVGGVAPPSPSSVFSTEGGPASRVSSQPSSTGSFAGSGVLDSGVFDPHAGSSPSVSSVSAVRSRRKRKRGNGMLVGWMMGAGVAAVAVVIGAIAMNSGDDENEDGELSREKVLVEETGLKPELTVGEAGDFKSIATALEFIHKHATDVTADVQVVKVLAGTYEERIAIEEDYKQPFPPRVDVVAEGEVVLSSDGTHPILDINGVKGIRFRGLAFDCSGCERAVVLTGRMTGSRIADCVFRKLTTTGIEMNEVLASGGEESELTISNTSFELDSGNAVGIKFIPLPNLGAFVTVSDCRFVGPMRAGIDLGDVCDSTTIVRCVFAIGTRGIWFSGPQPQLARAAIVNNTFYQVNSGILFDEQPSQFSQSLYVARNAFVDCQDGDVVVASGYAKEAFDSIVNNAGGMRFNWTTRSDLGAQEVDLKRNGGRGAFADWRFISTNPNTENFLHLETGSPAGSVGSANPPESIWIGAYGAAQTN